MKRIIVATLTIFAGLCGLGAFTVGILYGFGVTPPDAGTLAWTFIAGMFIAGTTALITHMEAP